MGSGKYSGHVSTKSTPQTEAVPGKVQVKNSQDGFVFQVSPKKQFNRFLILGNEGGTYYASEKTATMENATNAINFIKTNGKEAVELIVDVSDKGRAPKNDPAIFLLALACTVGDKETKALAYAAITKVCRIGTHIFQFCQAIQDLRGWSRGLRKGVANFYLQPQTTEQLAYQIIKYRQRDGWTHRDVLRLCHAKAGTTNGADVLSYAVGKNTEPKTELIQAFEAAQKADTAELCRLIKANNLSWEMLPTDKLKEKSVWEALLPKMPLTAMVRNLARMTASGLLADKDNSNIVCNALADVEHLKKSRLHPIQLLMAIKTYGSGHGDKGNLSWAAIPKILDSLDDAFEASFGLVEPTGKSFLLALDVSGSMEGANIAGTSLTAREASACMALLTAKTERDYNIMAFSGRFIPLALTRKSSFNDALKIVSDLDFDTTDCSLPMLYAMKHKLQTDVFCVYTDSETYAGTPHPFQALQQYRKQSGINAKLVVVGMCANPFTIADPSDAGMMDVVGFDTATPKIIAEFAKG